MINIYLIILELLLYTLPFYLIVKKKELAVIYLPLLFFITNLIDEFYVRAIVRYTIFTIILLYPIITCRRYKHKNVYALLLILYFSVLYLFNSHSLTDTRANYFSMMWLFLVVFMVPNIYYKYPKTKIYNELYKVLALILHLFILNTFISSLFNYAPNPMYGVLSGILFGGLFATDFNVLPVALFGYLLMSYKNFNLYNIVLSILSFALILLTLRRSVILIAFIALVTIVLLLLITRERAMKPSNVIACSVLLFPILLMTGNFVNEFTERFEGRFHDRELVGLEEMRFLDYVLVYEDLFLFERYDLWTGYEFFNAPGNYAGGIFGERNLHGDLPVIIHASGLIGLILYLMMVFKSLLYSILNSTSNEDRILILFIILTLIIYSFTGRVTTTASVSAIFLILFLPITNQFKPDQK